MTWLCVQSHAQNSIGITAGFLGTHTGVAEYQRPGRYDYLFDSVTVSTNVGSVQAALNVDFDLGKDFFLSTGFHYSNKGLANVTFTDSTGWPWTTPARQQYVGISVLIGYHIHLKQSRFGLQAATGLQTDFAIGTPNGGALFSGPYYRFFMPFSRFSETDLSLVAEAGATYKLGLHACATAGYTGQLTVRLESADGGTIYVDDFSVDDVFNSIIKILPPTNLKVQ